MTLHVKPRGFSLLEVVFSTLIVSIVLVGATNMLGASVRGRSQSSDRERAAALAHALLAELLQLPYEDPIAPVANYLGPESGESTGTRAAFNDVDDYHGWSESPPESKTGTPFTDSAEFHRSVVVAYVSLTSPSTVVGTDQGLKRIQVRVERAGVVMGEAWGLKARAT